MRRDVTSLRVMSRAGGVEPMQDAHTPVVTFNYEETLDLSLKLRLPPNMIPMLLQKLIEIGMPFEYRQNDDMCDFICSVLAGFAQSVGTVQTTEGGEETNAAVESYDASVTVMTKAVKVIHHDIYLTLMQAGVTAEEAGLQMTISDQEVLMWWLLLGHDAQGAVNTLFTTSMFRLANRYWTQTHSAHLPSEASLRITIRRVVRDSSPHDYAMLGFCNEGPDGVIFMVAVIANIVNGTTNGNIMCDMTVLQITTLLTGFVERRHVALTISWWALEKDGNQDVEANSTNGAASNADVRAAVARAKKADAGVLARDNVPDTEGMASHGHLESRRRPREDDEGGGSSSGNPGSSWREQGAVRRRRMLSGPHLESEEQRMADSMTEEQQKQLAIQQVADLIGQEVIAKDMVGRRFDSV